MHMRLMCEPAADVEMCGPAQPASSQRQRQQQAERPGRRQAAAYWWAPYAY
jgi:hypothetical protein